MGRRSRYLTKAQAIKLFRQEVMPGILANGGRGDVVMQREAWSNFTDALCANKEISSYQDRTWSNPF